MALLERLGRSGWLEPAQSAVIAGTGAALLAGWHGHLEPVAAPFRVPWWIVAVASAIVGLYLVRVEFRHDSMELTLGEVVVVLALFLASPAGLVAGRIAGELGARAITQRGRLRSWGSLSDLCFTAALTLLEAAVALVVFDLLRPDGNPIGPLALLVAVLANLTSGLARNLAVVLALRTEGVPIQRRTLHHLLLGLGGNLGATGLSLALIVLLWVDPRVSWIIIGPAGLALLSYQVATRDRAEHDSVRYLYEATRALARAGDADAIALDVLARARVTLQAEQALLVLHPGPDGGPRLLTRLGPGDHREVMVPLDGPVPAEARLADLTEATLLPGPIADPALRAAGITEAMVAPLTDRSGPMGALVLLNRAGGREVGFHDDELQLLQTLANHTSIALENLRLVSSLRDQALHDALTGLANRTLLLERTEQAIARSRRTGRPCAALLLDLDGFKTVNDSLGHAAGDQLLLTVRDRIRGVLRASDTPARLGGDEFAMLLDDLDDDQVAVAAAHRLLEALGEPVTLEGRQVVPAGSVGVAVWSGHARPDDLLRDADAAMYTAKRSGKGAVAVFRADMHQAAVDRLELETALRQAVRNDEIDVEYQPVVALQTGRIVGAEALVRWRRDDHDELLPSAAFITMAEETGLIVPIGYRVLERACHQLRAWRDELGQRAPVMVSVNLSARQARQAELAERVGAALRDSGLAPGQLELEVKESLLLAEGEAVQRRLAELRGLGVRLAIDDFGSGYSSLASLRRLRVDTVKIDGSAVAALTDPGQDPALTHAMIRLAHLMDLEVVAEGVETAEQLRLLAGLRCALGQGTYLARPMPAAELTRLLAAGPLTTRVAG
jgi:diguanylate cyclase (GGDEF)-like protein